MTSDRGNIGGGAAPTDHRLNIPVPPKSAGLNPNACEFLSSKTLTNQDASAWNEVDGALKHPVHALNNSVYEFTNGNLTKTEAVGVVGGSPSTSATFSTNTSDATPAFTNHVQLVQPVQSAAISTVEFSGQTEGAVDMAPVPPEAGGNSAPQAPAHQHHSEEGVQCLDGAIPEDRLRSLLRTQLDYYFSRENLAHDTYLISQMDSDHYVSIRTVAHFNQVKKLTTNMQLIVQVLRDLPTVQVDESGEKVRPNHNRCIVILREIPESTPLEQVKNLFSGKSCPPYVSCEFAHNDSWYVTFDSDEDAQRAYQYLREDVRNFLDRPIMARIKAKPLVRSTYYPRNGTKQTFESVTYPTLNHAALPPTVHAVSQQPAPPATPSPVYPSYTSTTAVPTVQYVNTNAPQQPFQFSPYPIMTWPAPTMLNPSMAFYYNDFQAESVKLSANPAPRSFPSVPRNRNPNNKLNRVPAPSTPLEVASHHPQQTPAPPPLQQLPLRNMNPVPEPRVMIAPERYPQASTAPPMVAPTSSSHQQVEPPAVVGGGNYGRRGDHSNMHYSSNLASSHSRNISSHQPPLMHPPPSAPIPHSTHTHSAHNTHSTHAHSQSSAPTPSHAPGHAPSRHTEPTKDAPPASSSRAPQKSYTSRRRRIDEEGAKNTKNSSSMPPYREHRVQQFELQPNSFPPLPGFSTLSAAGDLHIENKLSDVVKGTTKPLGAKDVALVAATTRRTLSPVPPSTPPTPPKDPIVTPITPTTPSSSTTTTNNNNNNNSKITPSLTQVLPEHSLPTPPNSPPHRSPIASLSTSAVSPPATGGSKVDATLLHRHHHQKDEREVPAAERTPHVIHNHSTSEEKPVKLSYAQMVQRRNENAAAAAATGDQSTAVNGDRSDSDSGGGGQTSSRAGNRSQNNNQSDQCQTSSGGTRSGSATRPGPREHEAREQRMRRMVRDRRNIRERRDMERTRVK